MGKSACLWLLDSVHRVLAPGKEMVLGEVKLPTAVLGTGKFTVQYEQVFGKSRQGTLEVDPTLKNLGTGKLDLEIKAQPPPAAAGPSSLRESRLISAT